LSGTETVFYNRYRRCLREINADVILKGTRVDGVYDCDPEKNASAVKFDFISFEDVFKKD
jgi:uridylate kinase